LSTDCQAILACAEKIVSIAGCEAEYRASIGRSYYSAFHRAKEFHNQLKSPGGAPEKDSGVHETLIFQLTNPTTPDSKEKIDSRRVGYILRSVKLQRVKSDYYLDQDITKKDMETALEMAKNIHSI